MKHKLPTLHDVINYYQAGEYQNALRALAPMLKRAPHNGKLWILQSASLIQVPGKEQEALEAIKRAIKFYPADHTLFNNMGIIYSKMSKYDMAISSYQKSIELAPNCAETWSFLGNARQKTSELAMAEACLKKAISLDPTYALAHYNLGLCYERTGQNEQAEACYKQALALQPNFIEALNNLAGLYLTMQAPDSAYPLITSALKINPSFSKAWFNLGNFHLEFNRFEEAENCYAHAFSLSGDLPEDMLTTFLFNISHCTKYSAQALFAKHTELGQKFEQQVNARYTHPAPTHQKTVIHIGFLSGDLHTHALTKFLEPVLLYLVQDPHFTLSAYSTGFKQDARTEVMKKYFHHYHDCKAMADELLAEQIYQDKVDILIDLSGHTAFSRLKMLAMRPAPIQASWLGYPGTSGMQAIDYYIASYHFLPEGEFDDLFTEKLVRLPCSSPFMTEDHYPEINELPGLHKKEFYFASFNRPKKLSPYIIGLWSQLMLQVPDAKLLLGHMPDNCIPVWLLAEFEKNGIGPDRLMCLPKTNLYQYFVAHHDVDLCLDAYPYGGGTTSMHALWMGVPTLTLAGEYIASRHGATIMSLLDLPEFVAHSESEFIRQGVYWSTQRQRLNTVRQGMRSAWEKNTQVQPKSVAHHLSQALQIMWARHQQQLPPMAIMIQEEKIDE